MKQEWTAIKDCRGMDNAEILDAICDNRGIEDLAEFLHPTEDALIPLDKLHNIDKAYKVIENAIDNKLNAVILADTDCDGVCAGSIMYRYLSHFTSNVAVDINEGKQHGIEDLETSADLLIVVDSINKATDYRKFTDNGTQVLVLDHHVLPDSIDEYEHITLVSSANDYPNPDLCGAAVVWKFCKYLDEMFLTDYADEYIDLAGTATIADMMNMSVPENRYITYEGLKHLHNVGLKAIVGSYMFDSQSVSFSVSPLINACNRMNRNQLALSIFLTDNETKAKQIVKEMKSVKEQQNELVAELMPELIESAESQIYRKVMAVFID